MGDWQTCQRAYAEEDLLGRACYAGLDLARTTDTCALVLIFPEREGEGQIYKQLAYFWLPQETARKKNPLVAYLQWARDGWLTLTPGSVCDYGFIHKMLKQVAEKFDLRKVAFDG